MLSLGEIVDTILKNTVKMLLIRIDNNVVFDDKFNFHKYVKSVIEYELYKINIGDNKFAIKFTHIKITGIKKIYQFMDFINEYPDHNKILIVDDIPDKAFGQLYKSDQYSNSVEIFKEYELLVNLLDNIFMQKYKLIKASDININDTFLCTPDQMPHICIYDPLARYYKARKGDVIKCIRYNTTSLKNAFYRYVV